jgi:hypothetical protein
MQSANKIQAQSSVYVHPDDKAIFMNVCKAAGYDQAELELVRQAYLNDPESGKVTYRALWEEMRPDRFAIMAAGINERIRAALAERNAA